jgi:predicted RNA-binding protein with TRAM domain
MSRPRNRPAVGRGRAAAYGVIGISLLTLALIAVLLTRPEKRKYAVIEDRALTGAETIETRSSGLVANEPAAESVYGGQIIDAVEGAPGEPREGWRYRVRIRDESRQGAAGVCRIGGMVTFVPGAAVGEEWIVEVAEVKGSVAEARGIERRREAPPQRAPSRAGAGQEGGDDPWAPGAVHRARVEDMGERGDGIVRLDGKVVFVRGAKRGQVVSYRIVRDGPSHAVADLVAVHDDALDAPPSVPMPAADAVRDGETAAADDVQPGRLFTVEITEENRRTPDVDGVARIGGLVVFVPNSRPGDRVRLRITGREPRFAFAENLGPAPEETGDGAASDQ